MKLILSDIEDAFRGRKCPTVVTNEDRFQDEADKETLSFLGLNWSELPDHIFDRHIDCFAFFTAEAFRYYLPGILKAFVEGTDNGVCASHLVFDLELNPFPEGWSKRFKETWGSLSRAELRVVETWIEDKVDELESRRGIDDVLDKQIDFALLSPLRGLETIRTLQGFTL